MRRIHILFLFCLLAAVAARAQSYTLTGQVDPVVHLGENFKLRYTLNTTDARNFTLGAIPEGIDVLIGPSQSTSISTVIVNGSTRTSQTLTLTYVLSASKTGKFTIPAASVKAGGQTVKSEPLTVQVIASGEQKSSHSVSTGDFFVLVTATKHHVAESEPFLLTFKVCWHPDLPVINLDPISLELQDVYMQPYNDVQRKSQKVETINGRTLCTVDWQQYVIYPQKAGTLRIPSLKFNGYIRENVSYDPFDPFTNSYNEVPRQLTTPAVDIQVDALTDKPTDFSGGVGRFDISAQLDAKESKENTPVQLTVKVTGKGNLNMLKEPMVIFPKGFDTYDAKQTDDFQLTADGLSGSVSYEFMAVPQHRGSFVIPPVKLTYFDPASHSYRTVQTDSFHIDVQKGDKTASAMHDYTQGAEQQAGDIRPIRTGPQQTEQASSFFGSAAYYIIMGLLVAIFVGLLIGLRLWTAQQADAVKAKGKRANKVAVRRLRKAAKLMKAGKPGEFYDETLRALWGYVGDKLNMPVSQLSRENISQQLQQRQVADSITAQFLSAIDECEFVRYAPGDPQGNMSRVYDMSLSAISQIESVKSKMKKAAGSTLTVALVVASLMSPSCAVAQNKVQADEAYNEGDYFRAIEMYEQVLKRGAASGDVYFNLGNAYYRIDSLAQAILAYERALLLQPGDDDARYNLQLAQSKTVDKIAPEREMFFVTWYHSLVRLLSVDAWAMVALAALALALAAILVYLFADEERLRRRTFFAGIALACLFLLAHLFAWQQQRTLASHRAAIVMSESLPVKDIPAADGHNEFTIHAGTKVQVIDDNLDDWKQIQLPDGRKGWVMPTGIEKI